eukprot:11106437-Alexandrium_andersonii.AAC.1
MRAGTRASRSLWPSRAALTTRPGAIPSRGLCCGCRKLFERAGRAGGWSPSCSYELLWSGGGKASIRLVHGSFGG